MPITLAPFSAFSIVATDSLLFPDAGVTEQNTSVIYLADGVLSSFVPGRSINKINGFESGKGYFIQTGADPLTLPFEPGGAAIPHYNDEFDI